jgi:hypothetical protein
MAVLNEMNDFLSIDGTDVSSYLRDVNIGKTLETADTTHGSGVKHRSRNAGLEDYEFSATLVYETADIATLLPLLKPGEHTVIWGPEGNGSGKPKHEQKFIFTELPFEGNYEQSDPRVLAVSAEASAPPVSDWVEGATFT